MRTCVYVCVCVCVCVSACARTCVRLSARTYVCVCACAGIIMCLCVRAWVSVRMHPHSFIQQCGNRRFPKITGEDNLTVFSYSGRVMSSEWRRQRRRADLRQFSIFTHGPVIIYTRLPAGGTYFPICMLPTNSECLIGISDALIFCLCLRVSVIFLTCSLYPNKSVPTLRTTRRHGPIYIYRSTTVGTYRVQSPGF